MSRRIRVLIPKQSIEAVRSFVRSSFFFLGCLLLLPVVAHAQSGSPFDTGFSNMQTLFTGTVAKVASLIAIVIGGYSRLPGGGCSAVHLSKGKSSKRYRGATRVRQHRLGDVIEGATARHGP